MSLHADMQTFQYDTGKTYHIRIFNQTMWYILCVNGFVKIFWLITIESDISFNQICKGLKIIVTSWYHVMLSTIFGNFYTATSLWVGSRQIEIINIHWSTYSMIIIFLNYHWVSNCCSHGPFRFWSRTERNQTSSSMHRQMYRYLEAIGHQNGQG